MRGFMQFRRLAAVARAKRSGGCRRAHLGEDKQAQSPLFGDCLAIGLSIMKNVPLPGSGNLALSAHRRGGQRIYRGSHQYD
jgi:hypothetical protein